MNLGLSIFLSTILICSVWLYYITKDKWNWKKILKYFGTIVISGILILGVISLIEYIGSNNRNQITSDKLKEKPKLINEFWDINLNESQKDVKFVKGNPVEIIQDFWIYYGYTIGIQNNKVVLIIPNGKLPPEDSGFNKLIRWEGYESHRQENTNLEGDFSTRGVKKFWGEPDKIIESNDELRRVYLYPDYNVLYVFKNDNVTAKGIFNPKYSNFIEANIFKIGF